METKKNGEKVGAYDAIKDNYGELQEQNKILKEGINKALDVITKSPPSHIVDNPADILIKISNELMQALRQC